MSFTLKIQENLESREITSQNYTIKDLILEFIEKYKNSQEFLFSSASARLLTGNSKIYFEFEILNLVDFNPT